MANASKSKVKPDKDLKNESSSSPSKKRPMKDSSNAATKTNTKSTLNRPAPEHYEELCVIWEADRRIPTSQSRRNWCTARNINPQAVCNWWSRRKVVAKKLKIKIPKDTYELPIGTPPTIEAKLDIKKEPNLANMTAPKRKKARQHVQDGPVTRSMVRIVTRSKNFKLPPSDDDPLTALISSDNINFDPRGSSEYPQSSAYSHLGSSPPPQDRSSSPIPSSPFPDDFENATPCLYLSTPPSSSPLPHERTESDENRTCNQGNVRNATVYTCALCLTAGIRLLPFLLLEPHNTLASEFGISDPTSSRMPLEQASLDLQLVYSDLLYR